MSCKSICILSSFDRLSRTRDRLGGARWQTRELYLPEEEQTGSGGGRPSLPGGRGSQSSSGGWSLFPLKAQVSTAPVSTAQHSTAQHSTAKHSFTIKNGQQGKSLTGAPCFCPSAVCRLVVLRRLCRQTNGTQIDHTHTPTHTLLNR